MLVYMEVPGLYVQTDTGLLCAIDHIDAAWVDHPSTRNTIRLTNPTAFPARVKVLVENSSEAATPLGQNALWGCQQVFIAAGQTVLFDLAKKEFFNMM
jgi:hypothetical protein